MSRRPWLLPIVLAFAVPLLCSACAEPPTREMDQAQGAIDTARAAGADRYATEDYQGAVDALQQARDAVAQRDYRLALNHALDSRERAQTAAKHAADEQVALRSSTERKLGEVTALLAQANQRLKAADAAHVPRKSLAGPRAAIADADTLLQKAGTDLNSGDYKASQAELADTETRLKATVSQLEGMTRGRGARPRR